MLPGDAPLLIDVSLPAIFRWPMRKSTDLLIDYEMGSPVLGDPSGGLDQELWTLSYVSGSFVLTSAAGDVVNVFSDAGATEAALAFDLNMRPFIAYQKGANILFRWFDSTINDFTITTLSGVTKPRACLDDRMPESADTADVILVYMRGAGLYYRQQRDRYLTEYELTPDCGGTLVSVGETTTRRLCFRIIP